jgi:hypothetical protein
MPKTPPNRHAHSILAVLLALLLLSTTGCITASLATLETVIGFVGSTASTGADVYKLGKLDAALMATLPDAQRAVRRTACDLGLELATEPSDNPAIWHVKLLDDKKRDITVRLEMRSARLCLCRVNVGIFGSEPTSKLIMERIRSNLLAHSATAPADDS